MQKVFDNLYVGSKLDASNTSLLEQCKIEAVFSFEFASVPEFVKAHALVTAADRKPINGSIVSNAFGFISSQKALGRNVLIHCQEGISRSPSLVAGYLAWAYGMTISQAVTLIQSKRPVAAPDPVFLSSIDNYVRNELDRMMGA